GSRHRHRSGVVRLGGLLPPGPPARRNCPFRPREKSVRTRLYRMGVDHMLARRHRLLDFYFSLVPLELPGRLQRIFSLTRQFVVEVETHPVHLEEYRFLTVGEILRRAGDVRIAPPSAVPFRGHTQKSAAPSAGTP